MTPDEERRHATALTTPFELFKVKEWAAVLEFVHRDGATVRKIVPIECIPPNARVGDLLYLTTEPTK